METGSRTPSIDALKAICRELDLTPEQRGRLFAASGLLTDLQDALALLPDDIRARVWVAAQRKAAA